MDDFAKQAKAFLQRAEQQYGEPFQIAYDQTVCGMTFPMTARYEKRDSRYFLGMIGSISTQGYCGETCYFLCTEHLDERRLAEYLTGFWRIHDKLVPAEDPDHEFTFLSVVLCAGSVEHRVRHQIRWARDYRQYKEKDGKHGWSALRLCVADLAEQRYYCNGMGKAVRECLTRDSMPQPKKPWWVRRDD